MAIATHMTVEEYLRTSFDPDCEFVDGEVLDRNVGETDHSWVQRTVLMYVAAREREWNVFCLQSWKFHVAERNYRVPDLVILAGPRPAEQILESRPLVCIEIL